MASFVVQDHICRNWVIHVFLFSNRLFTLCVDFLCCVKCFTIFSKKLFFVKVKWNAKTLMLIISKLLRMQIVPYFAKSTTGEKQVRFSSVIFGYPRTTCEQKHLLWLSSHTHTDTLICRWMTAWLQVIHQVSERISQKTKREIEEKREWLWLKRNDDKKRE